jgi:hypothetical protein
MGRVQGGGADLFEAEPGQLVVYEHMKPLHLSPAFCKEVDSNEPSDP